MKEVKLIERWCPKCNRALNDEINIQRGHLLEQIAAEAMQFCEGETTTSVKLYELLLQLETIDVRAGL